MPRKILVATDGSDAGSRAVDCAAELSQKLARDLAIVHVCLHGRPSAELMRLAEAEHLVKHAAALQNLTVHGQPASFQALFASASDELDTAKAIIAVGEKVLEWAKERAEDAGAQGITTHLGAGDYAGSILEAAESGDAEMIVVGRRGLGLMREVMLGSVSQKVLHHAGCTVVVTQ